MKEWVKGFGAIGIAGNRLTPILSSNGERERTELTARLAAGSQTSLAIRASLQ
jgi:hypothetical protein